MHFFLHNMDDFDDNELDDQHFLFFAFFFFFLLGKSASGVPNAHLTFPSFLT